MKVHSKDGGGWIPPLQKAMQSIWTVCLKQSWELTCLETHSRFSRIRKRHCLGRDPRRRIVMKPLTPAELNQWDVWAKTRPEIHSHFVLALLQSQVAKIILKIVLYLNSLWPGRGEAQSKLMPWVLQWRAEEQAAAGAGQKTSRVWGVGRSFKTTSELEP